MTTKYIPIANLRNFGQTKTRTPAKIDMIAERVNTNEAIDH